MTRAPRQRPVGVVACVVAASTLAVVGPRPRTRADDAPPGPAKAEFERRGAAQEARARWGAAVEERVQRWRRGGRFDEISAAAEAALARFPDDEAVETVTAIARVIDSANSTLADGPDPDRLDAWCLELALRALERLPPSVDPERHRALLSRVHLARAPKAGEPDTAPSMALRRRILAAVVGFLRRWFDQFDPLWDPTTPVDHYPPVRPSDPRAGLGIGASGPDDEREFLRVEEAYYASLLVDRTQRAWRSARGDVDLAGVIGALARLFPEGADVEGEIAQAGARVPELDVAGCIEIARRQRERRARLGAVVDLRLEGPKGLPWSAVHPRMVGRSPQVVLAVWNGTNTPKTVPLGLARVAVLYVNGPTDERLVPPMRALDADDLVVVEPNQRVERPLAIPVPRAGLARVVVTLANETARVGDVDGVWTGSERFVGLLDVAESRESPADHLAALPDDRGVEVLRARAVGSGDAEDVRAALEALIAAVDGGYGRSAHFAFAAVAADPARARDVRLRAVDGLLRFARDRLTGGFEAGPQARVVVDEAVPARLVAHVRARLEALSHDADTLVAERARAALAR